MFLFITNVIRVLFFVLFFVWRCRKRLFFSYWITWHSGDVHLFNDSVRDYKCSASALILVRVGKNQLSFRGLSCLRSFWQGSIPVLVSFGFLLLVADHLRQAHNDTISLIVFMVDDFLKIAFISTILIGEIRRDVNLVAILLFCLIALPKGSKLFFVD